MNAGGRPNGDARLAGCGPGRVVCLDVEHHANLLPWRDPRVVRSGPGVEATLAALADAVAAEPVALLAVTGASNLTGEVLPLDRVVAINALADASPGMIEPLLPAADWAALKRICG